MMVTETVITVTVVLMALVEVIVLMVADETRVYDKA